MTGNLFIDSAISVVAIAIMVLAARLAFGRPSGIVTLAAAQDRLAFDEPDFAAIDWLVDADAKAALARNEKGELALLFARGDDIVSRRFPPGALKTGLDGNQLVVSQSDHVTPKIVMQLDDGGNASGWTPVFQQGKR